MLASILNYIFCRKFNSKSPLSFRRGAGGEVILLLALILFTSACQPQIIATSSFAESTWLYSDSDTEYEIVLLRSGEISHGNGDDITPYNDFWYEQKGELHIKMNNGYSHYQGKKITENLIEGTARNKRGLRWSWKMEKLGTMNSKL